MATTSANCRALKQWGAVLAGGALVTAALYFTVFKSQSDKNATAQHALETRFGRTTNSSPIVPS